MNKKKINSIIMVIGVILIVMGILAINFTGNDNNEDNNNNDNNNQESNNNSSGELNKPEKEALDYNTAYQMAVSLYGGEGKTVELTEEEQKFIINVKDTNGNVLKSFNLDKETGVISGVPLPPISSTAGSY